MRLRGGSFRCHYPEDDYHVRLGEWLDVSNTPDCDVVEVRFQDSLRNVTYEYVHTQIFAPRRTVETTTSSHEEGKILTQLPDVHLLILDSVSSPQFMRSMPKSLRFLKEEMGAINFRHVSKVGLNSRPNAFPLLLGMFTERRANLANRKYNKLCYYAANTGKPLLNGGDYCEKPLDDEPFVGFEFKRQGYKTMMAEDWALGAFMWPSCKAFARTPVDHYMR